MINKKTPMNWCFFIYHGSPAELCVRKDCLLQLYWWILFQPNFHTTSNHHFHHFRNKKIHMQTHKVVCANGIIIGFAYGKAPAC